MSVLINNKNYDVKFENLLFFKLFLDETFRNRVMPILKDVYFKPPSGEYSYYLIFKHFNKLYSGEYKEITPAQVIYSIQEDNEYVDDSNLEDVKNAFMEIGGVIDVITGDSLNNMDVAYLLKATEKFAQDRAIEIALLSSVDILKNKPEQKMQIRTLLDEALCVTLNKSIGMNYIKDARSRFEQYQLREDKIPFLLESFNKATFNGFTRKSLNVFMAGTGIGKTLLMTSLVTDYIKQGYNVLYVSLEMSELRISMRVDANLIQVPIGDFGRRDCDGVPIISTDELMFKFNMMSDDKKLGTLMVKEYGSASINTMHIKALLKELKMVDGFVPDVIVIDYINLMNSSRFTGKNANSYTIVKAIAEELRGMAVEENAVLITATQTNREGIGGDEVSLDKVSESAGLPHTSDFFCGIFQTEQQREHSLFVLKVLKNRYSGYVHKKFAMGINYDYMRFYELSTEEERMIQSKNLDEVNLDDQGSDIDKDTTQAFIRKKRNRK